MSAPSRFARRTAALALIPLLALSACGGSPDSDAASADAGGSTLTVDTSPDQKRIRTDKVDEIAAKVPPEIRDTGELVVGASTGGAPPLNFYADDDTTLIGNETDIAQLVADVLGLELTLEPTSWENLFLSVESGQYDAALSNVTVTEERKEKYDFASYRVDELAWEAKADSTLKIEEPKDVAGLTVSVSSGTNQESVLLDWDAQNKAAGLEPVDFKYYQNAADYQLALLSGRLDLYFGPSPSISYHAAVSGDTKVVGTVPGGGTIPAEIAIMTEKDNGLVGALSEALNEVIDNGTYRQVLERWGLEGEAIDRSEINPPGLPKPES